MLIGCLSVWIGIEIGSCIGFLLGRFVFREFSGRLAAKYKITEALDRAIHAEGLKLMLMLRLCPLMPFNATNYAMGLTAITFWDFALGGFGMIPVMTVDIFVGTTLGSLTEVINGDYKGGIASLILLIVGCILAIVAIVWISLVVKKYLK